MEQPRIAIFGRKEDDQVLALADCVVAEGGRPLLFNLGLSAPNAPRISIGTDRMAWDGEDFGGVRAVYIRAMAPGTYPSMPPVLNAASYSEWRLGYVREQEFQAAGYAFFAALAGRGCMVVNRLEAYSHHNSKAQFYERMRAQGFDFPLTFTTSDPARAHAFVSQRGKVVIKPGIGVGSTRLLREEEKPFLDDVALCPVTMQEFVEGRTHRVHVVGGKVVLTLKILSEEIDSRTGVETKTFEPAVLPDTVAQEMVRANRSLGLHFAAWDIIVTAAGRHCLLDCNPGPYLMWIGEENVRFVYTQLARYMLAYSRGGTFAEAEQAVAAKS